MSISKNWGLFIAGGCAGAVAGLFGAGGGMVLVPLLVALTDLKETEIFSVSVSIILPVCVVSLFLTPSLPAFSVALPYLLGSAVGGVLAPLLGKRVPTLWLHRLLGLLILWGGVRFL